MPEENDKNDSSQEWPEDLLPRKPKLDDQEGTFMPPEGTNQPAEVKPTETPEPNLKPKKSHKGLIILLVALLILVGLGIGGWFAYQKYSSQLSFLWTKQPVDENDQIVQDMKNKAEIAQKEVRKKYSDAYLVTLESTVKSKGIYIVDAPVQNLHISLKEDYYLFYFVSQQNKKVIVVVISVESNQNKIVKITEESSNVDNLEAITKLYETKISYKKALEIADKNGGDEFKLQNSEVRQFGPTLGKMNENYALVWAIAYHVGEISSVKNSFRIRIDAVSGEVLSKHNK